MTDEQKAERAARKLKGRAKYLRRTGSQVQLIMGVPFINSRGNGQRGSRQYRYLLDSTQARFTFRVWGDSEINDFTSGHGEDVTRYNKPRHEDRVVNVSYMPRVPFWGPSPHGH